MSRRWMLAAGITVVALNLRPAIAAVAPLLPALRAGTGLSSAAAGLLTTLPVLCFAVVSPLVPGLGRRIGARPSVLLALVALTAGIGVRSLPGLPALFAGTLLLGGGIAVVNVALPGIVKRDFPDHAGLMTGVYTTALSAGAALAAGLTVPVRDAAGLGWRPALAIWGGLAVLGLLAWLASVASRGERREGLGTPPAPAPATSPRATAPRSANAVWRQPLAWQVTMFMGLQSLNFYAILAWLPTLFHAHGLSIERGGLLLSISGATSLLTSFAAPVLAARARDQRVLVWATVLACLAGLLLLLAVPVGGAYPAVVLLGLGQGSAIGLALSFFVLRAPDARLAAELSGMAQSGGYLVAAVGPLLTGALAGATGGWTVPLAVLAVLLVPELAVGLMAARSRQLHSPSADPRPLAAG